MKNNIIGVIGATSFVGRNVLPLLVASGWQVIAFSRNPKNTTEKNIEWRSLSTLSNSLVCEEIISTWICISPIWTLVGYFNFFKMYGVNRILAISSTSRFTKANSLDPAEQDVVRSLINGETELQSWAEENGVDWYILRPTMIYGQGNDKNVINIARLIRRWGFFPILGEGKGLRQPVYVTDVAKACNVLAASTGKKNKSYNLSGGETLSYKDMVERIFVALGKKPRFIHLPRWAFRLALLGLCHLPRFKNWSIEMVDRMNQNLIFEHKDASAEFGYIPRSFLLEQHDLF